MINLQYLIFLPIGIGIVLFIIPESLKRIKGLFNLIISSVTLYFSFIIFKMNSGLINMECFKFPSISKYLIFNVDPLSKLIALFIGIFGFLFALYSLSYITKEKAIKGYYSYYLITLGSAFGAIFADNMIIFIFFWGILGLTLYKLIKGYDDESTSAAKKTFILIGASDSILILGIGILWQLTGSFNMSEINIATTGSLGIIAFLSLLVGSFTKAGAMPFHSWVPDYVKKAPASSSAFLPASLDKLLGIYFFVRICRDIFQLTDWATLMLLIIGAVTIIGAVMMALVQHNYKKLLGYHAVSQVGYMITGIALGTPLGIAAGLFHMVNHALYKSGLFLTAGSVEKQTGKDNLDELGGLSKLMPITFFTALVCAFSISGIPPFNGFFSKWMIYQGIIDFGNGTGLANKLWMVWLTLAVFGSALTLASFIKLITGLYLGRRRKEFEKVKEVSFLMWLPQIIIAIVCIGFGIFAAKLIIPNLIEPASGNFNYSGIWQSQSVSILILVSVVVGFLIYLYGNMKSHRVSDSFIGGEKLQEETNFSPLDFYQTIKNFKFLNFFYRKAEKKWFDIYDVFKRIILWFNKIFSDAHNGFLPRYVFWYIAGLLILLIILIF
ncbi:MAG: NADH dehydrogenase [Candidatus Cloacimonetes bacterium]|jgi:formate hydrogenlyase subunit 3/multisubunit Na+/H+ antiporter MnhD subunit|nr:NADH dehydrogenase [Candidatus Cloacimonadota bacterium]